MAYKIKNPKKDEIPRCARCGRKTNAFKMFENGEWNWYCGECYRGMKKN